MLPGPDDFAALLAPARKALGMTQADVAKAVGVSVRAYQGYERGETEPSASKAAKLTQALNLGEKHDAAPSDAPAPAPHLAGEVRAAEADPFPPRKTKPPPPPKE